MTQQQFELRRDSEEALPQNCPTSIVRTTDGAVVASFPRWGDALIARSCLRSVEEQHRLLYQQDLPLDRAQATVRKLSVSSGYTVLAEES